MMRVREVHTHVLKLRTDQAYLGPKRDGGTIGDGYEVREPWRSLYSSRYETLLVEVIADDGTTGWGEALAPVRPRYRPPSSTCSSRRCSSAWTPPPPVLPGTGCAT
ncbi:hypothetical protein [Micromonospora sp. ATA51]|uniref:hypothetical protein n=1 Tax=Micromonospora sp. ATA51 TaxID=2806098 RepID=UPI001A60DA19|nr:hypothetical protein [Micromonospora sp. ATA51]MBM0224224.1 hypothetical protein [Micromonospora sp. ATA51]